MLIESLLKIRDKERRLLSLRRNRAQREYARRCKQRNIVLKARQVGITTYVAARFFLHTITRPGTLSVEVAHDQHSAEEIFRIVHRFWENLPNSLRTGALSTSRANVRQIVFPQLDSEYRVETAADANAGRGLTIHNLHCSEVARWPHDPRETLSSLRCAVPVAGEIVLESTPNGASGPFYEEWEGAAEAGYVRHFFPWWYEPSYRSELRIGELTGEERELIEGSGLTIPQIAFRRNIRASSGLAAQEFAEDPTSCFLASGECVFDPIMLLDRLNQVAPPMEVADNGRLVRWWPAMAGREYIIGVDPAGGGSGGDYSCGEVIDRITGLQCAELRGHFPPRELATRIARLGREYNDALVAVERNNHGHGVIAHLVSSENYPNLYARGGQIGWLTSAVSRPVLIESFAAMLVNEGHLISSSMLLNECRSFVRHEDGVARAAMGSHDDCIMAMAIGLAVRAETAGLRRRGEQLDLASLPNENPFQFEMV